MKNTTFPLVDVHESKSKERKSKDPFKIEFPKETTTTYKFQTTGIEEFSEVKNLEPKSEEYYLREYQQYILGEGDLNSLVEEQDIFFDRVSRTWKLESRESLKN